MSRMDYVVWSFEHEAWWGPDHCGYTRELQEAGRYTLEEAGDIVAKSIMLDELTMLECVAKDRGPPKFHPYKGKVKDG